MAVHRVIHLDERGVLTGALLLALGELDEYFVVQVRVELGSCALQHLPTLGLDTSLRPDRAPCFIDRLYASDWPGPELVLFWNGEIWLQVPVVRFHLP